MLGALRRLLLYRLLGARIMLGLAILGWLRRAVAGWRSSRARVAAEERLERGEGSGYQPSQGSSQTVHREPR
jgi:hypothetical protein